MAADRLTSLGAVDDPRTVADDQSDPFAEASDGPTPAGGARSIVYYLDSSGNPARKSRATQGEAIEMDNKGNYLFRSYFDLSASKSK